MLSCKDLANATNTLFQHLPTWTIELPRFERAPAQKFRTAMDKAEISQADGTKSPVTVPPRLALQSQPSSASPFPIIQRPQSLPPHSILERDGSSGSISDLMPHLHRSAPSIVKTRSGSVLSRGFILKTDYYPSGKPQSNLVAYFIDTYTT